MNAHTTFVPNKPNPTKGRLTIIFLTIKNASELYNTGDVDKYCKLQDNRPKNLSQDYASLENFTSEVYGDSVVLWLAGFKREEDNAGFTATLDLAAMKPEPPSSTKSEIFGGIMQIGSGRAILAWTKEKIPDVAEKYDLWLSLTNDSGISKQFKIDPILKGNPGSYYYSINFSTKTEVSIDILDACQEAVFTVLREKNIDVIE